jgi:hypothetical protein
MRTKVINVLDEGTDIYYVITQFEQSDHEICKKIGIPTNYTIINQISGSYTSTIAAYNFDPRYFENRVKENFIHGTDRAVVTMLHFIKDVKHIPDQVNVAHIRNLYNSLYKVISPIKQLAECINEYSNSKNLRKVFFKSHFDWTGVALFDVITKELIYKRTLGSKIQQSYPDYLWIPVKETTINEIENVDLETYRSEIYINGQYLEHFA